MIRLHVSRELFNGILVASGADTRKPTSICRADDDVAVIRRGTGDGMLSDAALSDQFHCPNCIATLRGQRHPLPDRITVGDVLVYIGDPPGGNPYSRKSLLGEERAAALRAWRDKLGNNAVWDEGGQRHIEPLSRYTFWYAPFHGGAQRLARKDAQRVTG